MLSQLLLFVIDLFLMLSLVNFARSLRPEIGAEPEGPEGATQNKSSKKHPTKAPPCPLCQEEHSASTCSPPDAPPKISHKRGRPRSIDTSRHFCPLDSCCYYGWLGRGNIRSNGHPNGGRNRQLECSVCNTTFAETLGTIFYRKKSEPETIWRVLTALAEGVPIQSVARIFSLSTDTVLYWLKEAAEQMDAVSNYLLHDLQLRKRK